MRSVVFLLLLSAVLARPGRWCKSASSSAKSLTQAPPKPVDLKWSKVFDVNANTAANVMVFLQDKDPYFRNLAANITAYVKTQVAFVEDSNFRRLDADFDIKTGYCSMFYTYLVQLQKKLTVTLRKLVQQGKCNPNPVFSTPTA